MTYNIQGTDAATTQAFVTNQASFAEQYGGDFVEGDEAKPVLVLDHNGNQIAFVIEGTFTEMIDLLDQAHTAITEAIATTPLPAELVGLVAPGEDYWTTEQMRERFTVEGFAAPYVIVRRKSDGQPGVLSFTHQPRYYYDWVAS